MKIKLLSLVAFLAISSAVSAQYYDSKNWDTTFHELDGGGWSTIWAEFNPSTFNVDAKGADNQSAYGISLGYSQAFPIIPNTYFCIEPGLGIQYTFYNENKTKVIEGYRVSADEDFSMWSIKLPVNFLYRIQLGNSTSSLVPFAGLTLRYNFKAQIKDKISYNNISESETLDLFKESDMGDDNTWNRFQIGWQAGLKAIIGNSFMIGASYGTDFSEISKKVKLQTATITLGFCF